MASLADLLVDYNVSDWVDLEASTPYGISNSASWVNVGQRPSFWAFISLCQTRQVDFFPITWYPGLGSAGEGGYGSIYQSNLTNRLSLVFKRWKHASRDITTNRSSPEVFTDPNLLEPMYRAVMSEVCILTESSVRTCPYIVSLEGVCWERYDSKVFFTPVLVFERAQYGDLAGYMAMQRSRPGVVDRFTLFLNIARGLLLLHRNREYTKHP
jgi:hypothetical protein